ncbi:MAG: ribosome maturation factor RimP [Porticoccaceae bacterium]
MARQDETLNALIAPVVEALDCKLWGLEYNTGGRYSVLRIYIDRESGIGIDECENVSRQVSSLLDVEEVITGQYTLEVSSPGLDRPLYNLTQYQQFAGEDIKLRLRIPFEGQRKFHGRLNGIEGDDVVLMVEDNEYLFPVDNIERATVVPRF